MEDSGGGAEMGAQIRPLWDPTGTVSVAVDQERGELVVSARGSDSSSLWPRSAPQRLGWVERRSEDGRGADPARLGRGGGLPLPARVGGRAAGARAERRAARRALQRGGPWAGPGRRLGDQATAARRGRRVSTLPFQVLFAERSSRANSAALRRSPGTGRRARSRFRGAEGPPAATRRPGRTKATTPRRVNDSRPGGRGLE